MNVDDATIDLNGFSLVGVPGSGGRAIFANGARKNLVVRNGGIRSWIAGGIGAAQSTNVQVIDLRLESNSGGPAIELGTAGQIVRCMAQSNFSAITTGARSVVSQTTSMNNTNSVRQRDHQEQRGWQQDRRPNDTRLTGRKHHYLFCSRGKFGWHD